MSTKHTPEPWNATDNGFFYELRAESGHSFTNVMENEHHPLTRGRAIEKANAERIVACVNACAGFDNPEFVIRFMKTIKVMPFSGKIRTEEIFAELDRLKTENEELKNELEQLKNAKQ